MNALETTAVFVLLPYLIWAVILSDSFFHRVWSLALCLCAALQVLVDRSTLPIPALYWVPVQTFLVVFCIALSPVQAFFHSARHFDSRALEIFWPNDSTEGDIFLDIIAVHGLASDSRTAWQSGYTDKTTSSNHPIWIRDFLPDEGLNARIMAFNHNTAWRTDALEKSLYNHGDDLIRALRRVRKTREEKQRPVVFIGHSFGGLIIKQAMSIANEDSSDDVCRGITEKVKGFIFLGVPHKGTRLTAVGRILTLFGHWRGASTSLLEVTDSGSKVNQRLHKGFMKLLCNSCTTKNTICVFESVRERMLGFPVIQVVEEGSAVIDGSREIGFDERHRNLQRFPSRKDERYLDVLGYLQTWARDSRDRNLTYEQEDCLKSLFFPEMRKREHDVSEATTGTCLWILEEPKYLEWLHAHTGLLWIKGNPGAGKSTLMKFLLKAERMRKQISRRPIVASCFFTAYGSESQKSCGGLFRSLLHQILKQTPALLSEFTAVFQERCRQEGQWQEKWDWHEDELRGHLKHYMLMASDKNTSGLNVYVDALDEAGETAARNLLAYFKEMTDHTGHGDRMLKICLSSRHYPLCSISFGYPIHIQRQNHEDIAIFTEHELRLQVTDLDELSILREEIKARASGTFLWAVLTIPIVRRLQVHAELGTIRRRLGELPSDLNHLYSNILNELRDDERTLSRRMIGWVYFAQRPLEIDELRYAVAADPTAWPNSLREWETSGSFFAPDRFEKAVVHLSCGLLEVATQKDCLAPGRPVTQFIHQSVKDYFVQHGGLEYLGASSTTSLIGAIEHDLSRTCLRYMMMEDILEYCERIGCHKKVTVAEGKRIKQELDSRFPFLRYSSICWILHAEKAQGMHQHDLVDILGWPSQQKPNCWAWMFRIFGRYASHCPPLGTTLLHIGAQYDFLDLVKTLASSCDSNELNKKDDYHQTPLLRAARNGHIEVAKLLLDRCAEADGAVLQAASSSGSIEIVNRLLDGGADINAQNESIASALPVASSLGQFEVMKQLLDGNKDFNAHSGDHLNALGAASLGGQTVMAQALLDKGRDINALGGNVGSNALQAASWRGHIETVKLLLNRGAKIDTQGGFSALQAASYNGHTDIVGFLLDKGASDLNPSFMAACAGGHVPIAERLLRAGADLHSIGVEGSPLAVAATYGWTELVKFLLERGAEIDTLPAEKPKHGWPPFTALQGAAYRGHQSIVELLLAEGADIHLKGFHGTPLEMAVRGRRFRVTDRLIWDAVIELLRSSGAKEPEGTIHYQIYCDGEPCGLRTGFIDGVRYKCADCDNLDLCKRCRVDPGTWPGCHDETHRYIRFDTPWIEGVRESELHVGLRR